MYIDSYEVVSLGTKYGDKGKEKKNQVLTHLHSDDGIQSKELFSLIESFDDNIHRNEGKSCKVIVEFYDPTTR